MPTLDLPTLLAAVTAGGPSALSSVTPLRPAAGPQAAIAPAKYVAGTAATYVYGTRYVDGQAQRTVLVDSSQSLGNRIEQSLDLAITDGSPVLGVIPRIRVRYERDGRTETFTDLQLPHRAFDAHVRAGTSDGKPVTAHAAYRAARDATPLDASGLLAVSPISLVLGAWDASRRARQGRWPSTLTGEIIGILADQDPAAASPTKGGARVDPVGMSARLDQTTLIELAEAQRDELSPDTYLKIVNEAKKLKDGARGSASALGFGGIPPTLGQLGGVACSSIIRSHVLSFAALRQIRFGRGSRGDAAIRAVLAAIAINGVVRSDAELYLRAHCHLVEDGPAVTTVDRRHGNYEEVQLPEVEQVDALLAAALDEAREHAGLDWHGQVFEVVGNPAIIEGAEDEQSEPNG